MTSLRKRGKMAAVLVAILCITTIFSVIPVTAFAAECEHSDLFTEYVSNYNGTHCLSTSCNNCYEFISSGEDISCTLDSGKCSVCGYEVPCDHDNVSTSITKSDRDYHFVEIYCMDCGELMNSQLEEHYIGCPCDADLPPNDYPDECTHDLKSTTYHVVDSEVHLIEDYCAVCGELINTVHQDHVFDGYMPGVVSYNDFSHRLNRKCQLCNCVVSIDVKHTFEDGHCTVCEYSLLAELPEGVPEDAIPAYVYQDEQGRWVVAASKYFGGYNLLNLLDVEFFYSNSDVIEVSRGTNEIVLSDSGVGMSQAKYDVLFTIDPGTYVYEYKIDSPFRDVRCYLYQYKSDGSTVTITNGKTFTAEIGDTYRFNFKCGTASAYYGKPFTWRVYDMTITSAECRDFFEPFGVRYFNNDLTYELYQNAVRNTTDRLSTYAAALDYINNVAYKLTNTKYSDLVVDSYANYLLPSFSTYYTNRYATMLDKTSNEYKMYQELIDNSSGTFNQGYTEGYAAAVRDFEGITDGGMVEGLINGAFNSVSDSYEILGSGISISGISVSGIVSTIVILLVGYFALKIIAR